MSNVIIEILLFFLMISLISIALMPVFLSYRDLFLTYINQENDNIRIGEYVFDIENNNLYLGYEVIGIIDYFSNDQKVKIEVLDRGVTYVYITEKYNQTINLINRESEYILNSNNVNNILELQYVRVD